MGNESTKIHVGAFADPGHMTASLLLHISQTEYLHRRRSVVLDSDRIFATAAFHDKMEARARANLRAEIDFWCGGDWARPALRWLVVTLITHTLP